MRPHDFQRDRFGRRWWTSTAHVDTWYTPTWKTHALARQSTPCWSVHTYPFFSSCAIFSFVSTKQAGAVSLSGTIFTVRFPASSGTLLYDPTLKLVLTPDDGDGFWRDTWFVWTASSLGVLVRKRLRKACAYKNACVCMCVFFVCRYAWGVDLAFESFPRAV